MIDIYLINAIALVVTILLYSSETYYLKFANGREINVSHAMFFCFWFMLLSLEYGLRGNFSTDYEHYRIWFIHAQEWNLDYIFQTANIEKGFLLLNYVIAQFSSEYNTITLTFGVLTIGAYFTSIKQNCKILWPPILLLIGSGVYYGGFNLSTQMLAGGVFALSVKYIFQRKPVKYFLLILLALTIHKSAIILFPIYFISYININSRNRHIMIAIIIMVSLFIGLFSRQLSLFLSSFLYGNFYTETSLEGYGWGYLIKNIAISAIVIWFNSLFRMENTKDKVIYIGNLLFCIFIVWSAQLTLIQRMAYFFVIFPMLAFAHIIKEYKGDKAILGIFYVVFFTVLQIGWFGNTYFTYMYKV